MSLFWTHTATWLLGVLIATASPTTEVAEAQPYEPRWQEYATPHFLVRHQGLPAIAARRAELLEQAYQQFFATFTDAGFELDLPRQPLACLLFATRHAMLDYARKADRQDIAWTAAYYSARTNRVALVGLELGMTGDRSPSSTMPQEQNSVSASPADDFHTHVASASTTHEAAHQLAFNTGLQQRGVVYPIWVSEGLATNFEFVYGEESFGPNAPNPRRHRHLREARDTGRLLPLVELAVTCRMPHEDATAVRALYAQSWGLFHYLFRHHPQQLAGYLAAVKQLPPGRHHPELLRAAFEQSFGDLETFDTHWQAWVRNLQ